MTKPFRYYLRVKYGECDAQKVVFNSRYGEYIDVAVTEFFRAIGWASQLFTGTLDTQLVKQTIEWKAPAVFDQVLEISVMAHHLGNTSFGITTEFRIAGETAVIATGDTIYVLVDGRTFQKTALSEAFRDALQKGAQDRTTDHAAFSLPPTPND